MKGLLCFISLLILQHAQAELLFENISAKDQDELTKLYPETKEANISPELLDEIVRYLDRLNSYGSIQVWEENQNITIKAVPLELVQEIKITGNKVIDADEVLNVTDLKKGMKFDTSTLSTAGEKLKEYYGRLGYLNAIIQMNVIDNKNKEKEIDIKITEKDPCRIGLIVLQTKNTELKNILERRIRKFQKKVFTEDIIAEIEGVASEYLASERYLSAHMEQVGAKYNPNKTLVTLTYTITEPYAYELIIEGNLYFSSNKIIRNLNIEEVSHGGQNLRDIFAERIRAFYLNAGFVNVKVTTNEKVVENFYTKQLHFNVAEGPRVRIKDIEVTGRISQPSRYYSSFIVSHSSEWIEDKIYVRDDLDTGIKNLITDLNNQGFLKARLQSVRVDYNDKKDLASIVVVLDEGPLTQLKSISFEGAHAFSDKDLLELMEIKPMSPLRLNELEASIDKLKDFYLERGYLEMKILNEDDSLVEYDDKGLSASIVFKIYEGPQVFVKAIVVQGNTFTKDFVIEREIGIDVGDMLTPTVLDEAQKRLDKLAIFSRIELKTLEANTTTSQRTLIVQVSEKNPGLFKMGAGITNKRGLTARGFAGLSYNNLFGTARAISLRGTLENNIVRENRLEYETSISYLEPFVFEKLLRGRVTYTHSEYITEGNTNGVTGSDTLNAKDSMSFNLERDLTSKIKLSWLLWGFDSNEKSLIPLSGPVNRLSRLDVAYIGPTIDLEFRDNPMLPTKGFFTRWDATYAHPDLGSSQYVHFVRTQATVSHYLQLFSPKWVWANSVSGGYVKNLDPNYKNPDPNHRSGVPESFAFFLGGANTIRGYKGSINDRIPNNVEFDPCSNCQLVIPGESVFQLYKSEVRFPIWGMVGGVVFYDAGQVDIQYHQKFQIPFRQSYGAGIRINTPVGPIVVDYGHKIEKLNFETPDAWHFSFGTF